MDNYDFEADQLASALEFALGEPSTPPQQPQSQPQYLQQQSQQQQFHSPLPPQSQQQFRSAPPGYAPSPGSMPPPPPGQFQPMPESYNPPPGMMPPPNMPPPNMPPPHGFGGPPPPHMMMMPPRGPPPGAFFGGMPPPPGSMPPPPPNMVPPGGFAGPYGGPQGPSPHEHRPASEGFEYEPIKYSERMRMRNTKRMSGADLFRIIRHQQMALSSGDAFVDDYYAIKLAEKKQKDFMQSQMGAAQKSRPADLLAEMQALLSGSPALAMNMLHHRGPLPMSEMPGYANPAQFSKASLARKTKTWHESNNVLGRSVKTNLKRPRELIAMQREGAGKGSEGSTFQGQIWIMRGTLEKIARKLFEIEDVHRVLEAKLDTVRGDQMRHQHESDYDAVKNAIGSLQHKQLLLCNALGELLGYPSAIDETGEYDPTKEVELTEGWDALFFLIWTPKGRQLVLRAIPCLLKPHLRSILRTFCTNCAYFVCRNPDGQDEDPVTDEEARIDLLAAATFADEFRHVADLEFVTKCLELTRTVFEQNPPVLSVFVHIPAGQEIIRTMIQHGKALSGNYELGSPEQQSWQITSESFYDIMQKAVAALEQGQGAN
mmetsp:Transcript_8258/g.14522  ORF Transcript_8258/g.14522 Transcript_8258/m.14522 type:complete len:600 (-) Transcript_8258:1545-3344(-)